MSSLTTTLDVAGSGLAAVNAQLALVSQNISNANTPGYISEQLSQSALTADGQGQGVVTGVATRSLDVQLQQDLFAQNGTVSAYATTQGALQPIDAVQGTVADGNDLSSLLSAVQGAFGALQNNPGSAVQQQQVTSTAARLAGQINSLANAYTSTRQTVQDQLVAQVGTLNTALGTIGQLSNRIIAARAEGASTADLENQRDVALQTVSGLVDIKYLNQPNGDLVVTTTGGLTLPTHTVGTAGPFSLAQAVVGPDSARALGSVPGIVLGGQDVTTNLVGGSIGAGVALRDVTLPTYQGELDGFAQQLSSRFAGQGLALFTDASGAVPAGSGSPPQAGFVGYAQSIQVNPAVLATPSLVRDGTDAIAGSPTGASAFTPNTDPAQTGFTALIQRVLDFSFGTTVQTGVPQPPIAGSNLGPAGGLAAPYGNTASLGAAAAALVGAQSQDVADAASGLSQEQAVQTTLQTKFSAGSAVNTDTELALMVKLQAAYGANAKIFTAVQSLWSELLASVTG